MSDSHNRKILPLLIGLSGALFVLDLFMPLGIAVGVLYAGVVMLAASSDNPRLPFLTALGATPLIRAGAALGPHDQSIPCGSASATAPSA